MLRFRSKKQAYSKRNIKPLSKNILLKSFTLTELLIVIIIISILGVIAYPSFRNAVVNSRDKEARSMLSLIAQSEEMYKLESGGYYIKCDNTDDCNNKLTLSINNSKSSAAWSYKVTNSAPPNPKFCAQANSTSAANFSSPRYFTIGNNQEEPGGLNTNSCP